MMRQWILGRTGQARAERADPTLQAPAGEVREPEESREYLAEERRLLAARKKAAGSDEGELVGLALSGGGIRSAAFSFGVVQALEQQDLMKHVDYLSTVSGGGYTGSAYSAWRLRQALYAERGGGGKADEKPRAKAPPERWHQLLPHLRNFSNYISPRLGIASAGTWRIISTMVRNLTIHWLALVSAIVLAFALLLLTLRFLWALSLGFAVVALVLILRGLKQEIQARRYFSKCEAAGPSRPESCNKLVLEVRRLLQEPRLQIFTGLGFYGLAAALWFVSTTHPAFPRSFGAWWQSAGVAAASMLPESWGPWIEQLASMAGSGLIVGFLITILSAALVVAIGFTSEWRWRARRDFFPKPSWVGLLFVFVLVLATWFGLAAGNGYFTSVSAAETIALTELFTRTTAWSAAAAWDYVWQTALILGLFALLASIIIAVLNEEMDREEREWATRIVAVSLTAAVAWLVLPGLALASSRLAEIVAFGDPLPAGAVLSGAGLSGAWLAVSGWAARLGQTEPVQQIMSKHWKRVLVAIGPAVFVVGLVVLACFGAALGLMKLAQLVPEIAAVPAAHRGAAILWSGWYVFGLLVASGVVFAIAGVILDPNEFSLHGFYRDRLVRCFLGASNADNPAPDSLWNIRTDDLRFAATRVAVERHGAPLHVINTAVNLFGSKDLRVQRRRSDSFILTPLHCGSRTTSYGPIPQQLFLGTAMAVSGAAVSPNMGVYTRDPALAALMTFFNLRLGYWFGNPRKDIPARRKRPRFAPTYLFAEAFALTNEDRNFIHLSDGGHYDNLGLYELLRRRCRYIIAVDAECDPQYRCTALAWLVRMARIDFGIEIRIDIERVTDRAAPRPRALAHWLLGEIRYPPAPESEHEEIGRLLYIKSSLLADGKNTHLGADVLEYASGHPDFPHESTADQFFSESQFESYRMLGECIAAHVLKEGQPAADITATFERLEALGAPAVSAKC